MCLSVHLDRGVIWMEISFLACSIGLVGWEAIDRPTKMWVRFLCCAAVGYGTDDRRYVVEISRRRVFIGIKRQIAQTIGINHFWWLNLTFSSALMLFTCFEMFVFFNIHRHFYGLITGKPTEFFTQKSNPFAGKTLIKHSPKLILKHRVTHARTWDGTKLPKQLFAELVAASPTKKGGQTEGKSTSDGRRREVWLT